MFWYTKKIALDHLIKALDLLEGVIDQSQDLLHCIDELQEVFEHLKCVEAEGE